MGSVGLLVAQQQANYWYFGQNAGLSFASGTPVAQLDGALNTMEGCSSISTDNGTLRFYTDGIRVWNRDHVQMPNGFGLLGDPSSSQSGIIVPRPASDNLYYIITIDDVANGSSGLNGINYSMVDMNLQGWKGDVVDTVKNINLTTPMCEKVTAVGHDNGFDTWVITQKWGTNHIYAYLVTNEGVNHDPVISELGLVIGGLGVDIDNAKGYMKVSPNGEVLAKGNAGLRSVEIFDFNNATGRANNAKVIPGLPGEPYGIEFSPDGKLLYVNTWKSNPQKKLLQYNLEAGDINDIIASKYEVASGTEGALQIAPDNRIYVAMRNSGSLSRINSPNSIGADCNFEWATISLGGRTCSWGLPPFIQSYFSFNAAFYNDKPCFTIPTQFYENSSQEPDSVLWNFGDTGSGADNTTTEIDPLHLFSKLGLFSVSLTVWIEGIEVSVNHLVIVGDKPYVNLGNDTSFCQGELYLLDAGPDFDAYLWQNGEETRTITVNTTGTYWVEVTVDDNCSNSDTVSVTFTPNPVANAGSTQTIVMGTSTTLDGQGSSGSPPYNYLWSPASELVQNDIANPTTVPLWAAQVYTLNITDINNCVAPEEEVLINVYEPGDELGILPFVTPSTICVGEEVSVESNVTGGTPGYQYTWTSNPPGFSSTEASFTDTPQADITYLITVDDSEGGTISSSVSVVVNPLPVIDLIPQGSVLLGTDTIIICVRDSAFLDAGFDEDPLGTSYLWTPAGLNNRYYTARTTGSWIDFQTHNVEVTNYETGCFKAGGITIMFDFNECAIGVEETPDDISIIGIQPNPNDGSFTMELNENLSKLELKVLDIRGQQVYYKKFKRNYSKGERIEMNIEFPEKGMYFIMFSSDQQQFVNKVLVR